MTSQPMTKCKFCGKELIPIEVPVRFASTMTHIVGYEPCDCKDAQTEIKAEEQKKIDLELKTQKERRLNGLKRAGVSIRTIERIPYATQDIADTMLTSGVYLYGSIGTGKTTAAELALMNLFDEGHESLKIVTAPQMISTIRKGYNMGSDVEDYIRKFVNYEVLVIDDIGKESPTEDSLMLLYRVIDDRYKATKPTSCTSNYKRSELIERLGQSNKRTAQAIVSRLSESIAIEYKGKDKRLENNTSANVARFNGRA